MTSPERRVLVLAVALAVMGALLVQTPGASAGQGQTWQASGQGDQGLQGGWAVDNAGNVVFLHSLTSQYGFMQTAGAGWVRVNFRLGACFKDWTSAGCNGTTALQTYAPVVKGARDAGLQVLGLLSNESWPGDQQQWTAGNAETTERTGDNQYARDFSAKAAGVLAAAFAGQIAAWEIWNEPNAWTFVGANGQVSGGTFLYPSNFAWLLKRSYQAIKTADSTNPQVISGGVLGHDPAGVARVLVEDGRARRVTVRGDLAGTGLLRQPASGGGACSASIPTSGADYVCATYAMGIAKAGWVSVSYPLDGVGQHLYVDQGGPTSSAKLKSFFDDLRNAYGAYEGQTTIKKTHVTEIGWTTDFVPPAVQAKNLQTAYQTARSIAYVLRSYWFNVQDIPEASLAYGLVNGNGTPKPAFRAYQTYAR